MNKTLALLGFVFVVGTSFSQDKNPEFGNVTVKELKEEFYPLDSTAHAAYLYREKTLTYFVNTANRWAHRTKVYDKIKIYDKKGFEEATKAIPLYKSDGGLKEKVSKIKAYTYSLVDGKILKTKLNKDEVFKEDVDENWFLKKFTMPALEKGVIVEWSYTITSPFSSYLDSFIFQKDIPVQNYSSVIVMPEHFSFKIYRQGAIPINIQKYERNMRGVKGKERIYIIEVKEIPAFKEEAFMSSRKNFIGSLDFDFSYYKDPSSFVKEDDVETWNGIAKKIFKSSFYGRSLKKKKYYEEDFLSLKLEGKSDKEKIAIILDFVKSKIKWNGEYGIRTDLGVKKAYETGEGNVVDVNLVLVSLLKRAGLNANLILISTRSHGVALFPSIKAYNYIIVGVEGVDKELVLLDATEKYSYLNVLPYRDLNWVGRLVREDETTSKINLSPNKFSLEKHHLRIKIEDNLSLKGVLSTTFTLHNALKYRKKTNSLSKESHIESVEKEFDINIEKLTLVPKDKLHKPYVRLVTFNANNGVDKIGDKIYFSPLFFLKTETSPFKLDNRDYPVDFGYPWKDLYQVYVELPKGYEVDFLPQGGVYNISDSIGSYEYKINQKGNFLIVSFSIQFNIGVISPQHYKELKTMYRQMISKQSEKIVLKKRPTN